MGTDITTIGIDWLSGEVDDMTDHIEDVTPVDFNEATRYLPDFVTDYPGPLSYDINPWAREIVNNADVNSPIREVYILKGVQITWSTILESIALYFMAHIKTAPMMYVSAEKALAERRLEGNFLPMIDQSGLSHIIQSQDVANKRKTGRTKERLSWVGGGYLVPEGANNAVKARDISVMVMLMDELDGWPWQVGKDGDPFKLFYDRTAGSFHRRRKVFAGSTPLVKGQSKTEMNYERGDQRKYFVRCKHCGFAQFLQWSGTNKETGKDFGFAWDYKDDGTLDRKTVRYHCQNCAHEHFNHDKERLFHPDYGAEWRPTATPVTDEIRSYWLPSYYSPVGFKPWEALVVDWLDAWDVEKNQCKDVGKLKVFYNNVRAKTFAETGGKVWFERVSGHRRPCYVSGNIPNDHAKKHTGGPILFLTCTVDVQLRFLAVAVIGWTRDARCYLIEYLYLEASSDRDQCDDIGSSVWTTLSGIIEEKSYTDEDGNEYKVMLTLIDSNGMFNDVVCTFCEQYETNVYPIIGRARPPKHAVVRQFAEFTTVKRTVGFHITVDYYKDRMLTVLRRQWVDGASGEQQQFHFNAPQDVTDKQLKELTVESLRKKTDDKGEETTYWYRPGNARNELWDILGYAYAAVDIFAWHTCIQLFECEDVDWKQFWDYMEEQLRERLAIG